MAIFILNNGSAIMMYDWEKINDEYVSNEFKPLKSLTLFPTYELFNIDNLDYNYMQQMISCNIIIPITFEEDNGEDTNRFIED